MPRDMGDSCDQDVPRSRRYDRLASIASEKRRLLDNDRTVNSL